MASDKYKIFRDRMNAKWGYCGPYRLGIAVAEAGEHLPPPPHYQPRSCEIYEAGIKTGLRIRLSKELTLPGFTLRLMDREGSIWIERDDGEGAELSLADFTKHVEAFYNERF